MNNEVTKNINEVLEVKTIDVDNETFVCARFFNAIYLASERNEIKLASMLSTSDNPWNPFTNFREWFAFDVAHGYNSCAYLARIANVSPELSPDEYDAVIETAIDECLKLNLTGNRIKVEPK